MALPCSRMVHDTGLSGQPIPEGVRPRAMLMDSSFVALADPLGLEPTVEEQRALLLHLLSLHLSKAM